jgi:hypothetical protein
MSYSVTQVIILSEGNTEYVQDRQRTLNGTLRRVFVTIIVVEKHLSIIYTECVFVAFLSSMQSARAVLYCHLWPVRLYSIFPHCTKTARFFENK